MKSGNQCILLVADQAFRALFEKNRAVMLFIEPFSGTIVDANPAAADYLGYPRARLREMTIAQINTSPSQDLAAVRRKASSHQQDAFEFRYRLASGELRDVEVVLTPIAVDDSVLLFSIVQDITRKKETERVLRIHEDRYRATFESSLDGISIGRLDSGAILDVNPAFLSIFGYARHEVVGHSSLDLGIWVDPEDRRRIVELMRSESQCQNIQARFRKKNGISFWGLMSVTKIDIDGGPHLLFVFRDTTDSKEAERKIAILAFFDQLTGLPNRSLLLDRLHVAAVSNARRKQFFGLMLVDFDNLRSANDVLGLGGGDQLLVKMAERLMACVRAEDTVARLGSDEFAILMTGLGRDEDAAVAKLEMVGRKMLSSLRQPWPVGDRAHQGSASIGIALFDRCQEDSRSVLKQAEIAMYRAKDDGGDCLRFFNADMERRLLARTTMERELKSGIGEKQFFLVFQPQVSDRGVTGAEALVRWRHPVKGMVCPGDFIPLAEETGAIVSLGDWILREACNQLVAWSSDPMLSPLTVSVNISARQFQHPDFVERTLAILEASGVPANKLKFELTESALFSDIDEVKQRMCVLKQNGIVFSLDDFGTGFSSLSHLKKLPIDQLKIDRSFVNDMLDNDNDAVIVKSIVSLGKNLGLEVIAEGVETHEQKNFLGALGCMAYQGYLLGHPLPAEAFADCVDRYAADSSAQARSQVLPGKKNNLRAVSLIS